MHETIDVEFFEQGSTQPFAASALPISQLPDKFEIHTTLRIGENDWHVSSADPFTKVEFGKTGRVRVFLVKIQHVAPSDILFGLPTINHDTAALEPAESLENVFVVSEDDWRQSELVCSHHMASIEAELAAVLRIYETEAVGVGFRRCHARSAIPAPLDGASLSIDQLHAALDATHAYAGVAFNHMAAVVSNGFAFRSLHGFTVWGQLGNGREVKFVCLPDLDRVLEHRESREAFDGLLVTNGLVFVDWVHLRASSSLSGL